MHLSVPSVSSINDYISKEEFTLTYSSVDDAVRILSKLGRGALMAKANLQAAFRNIPVCQEDWDRLGVHWQDHYYVDTRLPFGLRSVPFLFNECTRALLWIIQHNYGIPDSIHYLDDFYLAGPAHAPDCQRHIQQFITACKRLGFPLAMEKLEGPSTSWESNWTRNARSCLCPSLVSSTLLPK